MKTYRCKKTVYAEDPIKAGAKEYFTRGFLYMEPGCSDEYLPMVDGTMFLIDNTETEHQVSHQFLNEHFDEVSTNQIIEQNWRRGRWKRIGLVAVVTIGIIWYLGKTWWS